MNKLKMLVIFVSFVWLASLLVSAVLGGSSGANNGICSNVLLSPPETADYPTIVSDPVYGLAYDGRITDPRGIWKVNSTGYWFAFPSGQSYVSSIDEGLTWVSHSITFNFTVSTLMPWIVNDTIYTTYYFGGTGYGVYYRRGTISGVEITWDSVEKVYNEAVFDDIMYASIVVDTEGVPYICWGEQISLHVRVYSRSGGTWASSLTVNSYGYPAMTPLLNGTIYLIDGVIGDKHAHFFNGTTWTDEGKISVSASYNIFSMTSMGNTTYIAIGDGAVIVLERLSAGVWVNNTFSSSDYTAGRVSIAVDVDSGNLAVFFWKVTSNGIYFLRRILGTWDTVASWWAQLPNACTPAGRQITSSPFSVDNKVGVVWCNGTGSAGTFTAQFNYFEFMDVLSDETLKTEIFYSNSKDGYVEYYNASGDDQVAWDIAHDAATGTSYGTGEGEKACFVRSGSGKTNIVRGFLYFDSSALPNGAILQTAVLSVYVTNYWPDQNILAMKGTQSDTLSSNDFDAFSGLTYGGVNTQGGWRNITFNAQGKADVNLTGWTKICLRNTGNDYADVKPSEAYTYIDWGASTHKPTLIVTYRGAVTVSQRLVDLEYSTVLTDFTVSRLWYPHFYDRTQVPNGTGWVVYTDLWETYDYYNVKYQSYVVNGTSLLTTSNINMNVTCNVFSILVNCTMGEGESIGGAVGGIHLNLTRGDGVDMSEYGLGNKTTNSSGLYEWPLLANTTYTVTAYNSEYTREETVVLSEDTIVHFYWPISIYGSIPSTLPFIMKIADILGAFGAIAAIYSLTNGLKSGLKGFVFILMVAIVFIIIWYVSIALETYA